VHAGRNRKSLLLKITAAQPIFAVNTKIVLFYDTWIKGLRF